MDDTVNDAQDDTDQMPDNSCWICQCVSSSEEELFYPCACRGSMKYVHETCLAEWLRTSARQECSICRVTYSFGPAYHVDVSKGLMLLPFRDSVAILGKSAVHTLVCVVYAVLVAVILLGGAPTVPITLLRCMSRRSLKPVLGRLSDSSETDKLDWTLPDWLLGVAVVFIATVLCRLHRKLAEWMVREVFFNQVTADDMFTWRTMLGFAGMHTFVIHFCVVMVVCVIFEFLIVFIPYNIGRVVFVACGLEEVTNNMTYIMDGVLVFAGNIVTACLLRASHFLFLRTGIQNVFTLTVLPACYFYVRCILILIVEVILLPLTAGWLLDIISQMVFDKHMTEPLASFHASGSDLRACIYCILGYVILFWLAVLSDRAPVAAFRQHMRSLFYTNQMLSELLSCSIPNQLKRTATRVVSLALIVLALGVPVARLVGVLSPPPISSADVVVRQESRQAQITTDQLAPDHDVFVGSVTLVTLAFVSYRRGSLVHSVQWLHADSLRSMPLGMLYMSVVTRLFAPVGVVLGLASAMDFAPLFPVAHVTIAGLRLTAKFLQTCAVLYAFYLIVRLAFSCVAWMAEKVYAATQQARQEWFFVGNRLLNYGEHPDQNLR